MRTLTVDGVIRPVDDAKGRVIGGGEPDNVRAFWRWFGNSKTVDELGRPIPYYHGTSTDFATFEAGNGFTSYFTRHADIASDHAEWRAGDSGGDPSVMVVYLRIENPIVLDGDTCSYIGYDPDPIADLQRRGHDGIIANDDIEVVVFSPWQIKSAIGNPGAFMRTSAHITDGQEFQLSSQVKTKDLSQKKASIRRPKP